MAASGLDFDFLITEALRLGEGVACLDEVDTSLTAPLTTGDRGRLVEPGECRSIGVGVPCPSGSFFMLVPRAGAACASECKSKMLEQQVSNADVELHGLRDRYKQEETAVVHLKGAVANSEAIRSELVERLSDNARLDAHREHSMHQVMAELHRTVAGFRYSEVESESEQRKIFLGWYGTSCH